MATMNLNEIKQKLIETGLTEKAVSNITNQIDNIVPALRAGRSKAQKMLSKEQINIILSYEPEKPSMSFGKYKGKKVVDIAQSSEGRSYLTWAIRNIDAKTTDAIIRELRKNGFSVSIENGISYE